MLGGGIYIHEDETYRNWEYDYEPPENERVPNQTENTGDSSQGQPPQPPPQPLQRKPQKQTQSESTPKNPVARRTRASKKTEESLDIGDFTLSPLTPKEQKLRENNLSHMTHIREAMKSGLEKWKEELKKEKRYSKKGMAKTSERCPKQLAVRH